MGKKNGGWKSISVPSNVYQLLQSLKLKLNKPIWRIILDSVSLYQNYRKTPSKIFNANNEEDKFEKVVWYIFKLTKSLGAFHENPTNSNMLYFKERLEELKERVLPLLNGNSKEIESILVTLETLAKKYKSRKEKEVKIEMNNLTKNLIKLILLSL